MQERAYGVNINILEGVGNSSGLIFCSARHNMYFIQEQPKWLKMTIYGLIFIANAV